MNKKTIERLRQQKEAREKQHRAPHTPPPTSDGTPAIPPLPSCGEDSAFSPLQSPPDAGFTIDSQSPSSFNLDSFSFQDSILPESGLGCMEDWLPTIPGGTIDSSSFPLYGGLTETHIEKETSNTNCAGILNGSNVGNEKSVWHNASATEIEFPSLFPCSPKSSRCDGVGTKSNNTFLSDRSTSSLLGSSCYHFPSGGCFSTLSNHLCTLQAIPQTSEQARAIDILLMQSQRIIPSMRSLFKCHHCMRDPQALFLVNMVLARLLKWSRVSICTYEKRSISAEVRLGKYQVSGDFGTTVAKMLIKTHLADLKATVHAFAVMCRQTGHGKADGAYLSQQAKGLETELNVLAERIEKASNTSTM
ncbi:hypothetical protein N7504_006609 [Penicillium tannophilum]|nr:hypothetical protein N7504_006609 [Penicillium tannophilum]